MNCELKRIQHSHTIPRLGTQVLRKESYPQETRYRVINSNWLRKFLQNHTFLRLVIVFYQNWIYKYMFWLQNRGGVKKGLDLYLAIPVNIYWSYFDCYFDLYWCYFDVLFWFIVWLIVLIYVRLMSCLSDWFIASLTSFLSSSIHPNFIFRSFVCLLT